MHLPVFHISIDQHDMSIIEMDGVEMEPYPVDLLSVAVAQRYSILVEAKNETNANFNMLVAQDAAMYDALPDGIVLNNTVTIQYAENNPEPTVIPEHQAINEDGDWPMFDETPLVPVLKMPMAPADVEYVLEFNFDVRDQNPLGIVLTSGRPTTMEPTVLPVSPTLSWF
jgi:iron transport multicopper oxidase